MGVAMAMASCSDIDESERLLNVDKPGTENPDDDGQVVTRKICLLYTSPSPRDLSTSRMPSSA